MSYFFRYWMPALVVVGLIASAIQAYIFFTHCYGVPMLSMPAECALLIYTSK